MGHWCVCLSNEDPLTDYGPSGLVYTLPSHCHPCFLAYRCKASAFRPHRAGGVLALTYGLGNDKGPERPAVLMSFVRDGNSREILAAKSWSSEPLASWNDGEWLTLILRLDWKKRNMEIIVKGSHQQVQKQVPFANVECDAVKYLVLYNHTGVTLSVLYAELSLLTLTKVSVDESCESLRPAAKSVSISCMSYLR